ncbi:hypothetical protein [Flavobacterium sp. BFFFF1]|uniref:hypothetical protein n=1 Tax=Flavobacterium sp. BFFFF1 TaxID=2015557 RepID=UPI0025BDEF77|nr:hypothetical protein [Flavobacterium sp. BFFFF1]
MSWLPTCGGMRRLPKRRMLSLRAINFGSRSFKLEPSARCGTPQVSEWHRFVLPYEAGLPVQDFTILTHGHPRTLARTGVASSRTPPQTGNFSFRN